MTRGQRAMIEVDGRLYEAKYVGKGKYSRVYQIGNRVVYYTTGDCAKEVISMFQYDRMMHLPEIVRHNNVRTSRAKWYVFSSPYYRDVTKKDTSAYRLARRMVEFYMDHYGEWKKIVDQYGREFKIPRDGRENMQRFVAEMDASGEFPRSVIRAMQELVDVSSNCGDQVGFDLHMKNFGVNEYGVLIFRDLVNPLRES